MNKVVQHNFPKVVPSDSHALRVGRAVHDIISQNPEEIQRIQELLHAYVPIKEYYKSEIAKLLALHV